MNKNIWVLLIAITLLGIFIGTNFKSSYNKMVKLREDAIAQAAQVENVYERRSNLIPQITSLIEGMKDFETKAVGQLRTAHEELKSMGKMGVTENGLQKFNEAQDKVEKAIAALMSEYGGSEQLRANERMNVFVNELEGSENRISVEKRKYHDKARIYNTFIKGFPKALYAGIIGFSELPYFERGN